MLDDLRMIHDRDSDDALGVAEKQSEQLHHSYNIDISRFQNIQNIVFAGMGGSALPVVYLQSWPGVKAPFEIVRNYHIPEYVDGSTLFVSMSHSGNTEETLSCLQEAEAKGAQIAVIAAGGQLVDIAKEKNYPVFLIPKGIQPRMSSFYFLVALMELLEPLGLVPAGSKGELQGMQPWLAEQVKNWLPAVPTKQNPAKELALELIGKSVVVYSGPRLFPAANKFKICLNENAKNVAWVNQYPELNHNEFIGWTSHPIQKPYAVVEIRSNLEHSRVQKRFEVTERLLSGKRPAPMVIEPAGETLIQQLLWASNFSDFVSIYTAILNGLNPTPVELVEKLKKLLDE